MTRARFKLGPLLMVLMTASCGTPDAQISSGDVAPARGGQAAVVDDESQPNVVRIAVSSKDHTTLVAALKAADLVNALANAGPFTVFAPNNAAFEKLPAGTVDDLLKPANKAKLTDVLTHHVTTSAREIGAFADGQSVWLVDGTYEKITRKGGDVFIGNARVIASVRASNGWVHVIDAVLVPGSGS